MNILKILYKQKLAVIIGLYIIIISSYAYTQNYYEELICIPTITNTGFFYNSFANSPPLANGTKFVDKDKKRSYPDSTRKYATDTTAKAENRIKSIRSQGDYYKLELEVIDLEQNIQISVFNLLAKKVLDVHNGKPYRDGLYDINTRNLPNGLYICVVQGLNFRLTERFVVSR